MGIDIVRKTAAVMLCVLMIIGALPLCISAEERDTSFESGLASDLKALGLFKGVSDTEFDLGREPTRIEAVIMLVRLLGKEGEATEKKQYCPFADVPEWANNHIGWAWRQGLTAGRSKVEFGAGNCSAAAFLTFVLRALGYDDTDGRDFTWDKPFDLAKEAGILPDYVDLDTFLRADAVVVAYAALSSKIKNGDVTLAEKLASEGVFSQQAFREIYRPSAVGSHKGGKKTMTAAEIYEMCSPAVFYVETKDIDGDTYASGSGFFISDNGTAVTNRHVIKNAASADIYLTDGRTGHITSVLYSLYGLDSVVVATDLDDTPYLELADSSSVTGGEEIFAIGNPEGLKSTISDGIISNPRRDDFDGMIQITAPISHGSSGGALIDKSGRAVGITTATLESGQNLNFAVPINEAVPHRVSSYTEVGGLSLSEFLAQDAVDLYENRPEPGACAWLESEPNNTFDRAGELENGDTFYGSLSDGDMDLWLYWANTTGRMIVTLYTDAELEAAKYIALASYIFFDATDLRYGDLVSYDDGTYGQTLEFDVKTPGTYVVDISIYGKDDVGDLDYVFYFEFIPDDSSGGSYSSNAVDETSAASACAEIGRYLERSGDTEEDPDGGTYYYIENRVPSDDVEKTFSMVWYPSNGALIAMLVYVDDAGMETFAYLRYDDYGAGSDSRIFAIEEYDGDLERYGDGTLSPSSFGPDTALTFETYTGSGLYRTRMLSEAVRMISEILSLTDEFCAGYGISADTSQLGF